MNANEDDSKRKTNRGMSFWTGQGRGDPIPPPHYERPVFGTPTSSTGDLFNNITVYIGADIPAPAEGEEAPPDDVPPAGTDT